MIGIKRKLKCKEERRDYDYEGAEGIMCRIKEEKIGNKSAILIGVSVLFTGITFIYWYSYLMIWGRDGRPVE